MKKMKLAILALFGTAFILTVPISASAQYYVVKKRSASGEPVPTETHKPGIYGPGQDYYPGGQDYYPGGQGYDQRQTALPKQNCSAHDLKVARSIDDDFNRQQELLATAENDYDEIVDVNDADYLADKYGDQATIDRMVDLYARCQDQLY